MKQILTKQERLSLVKKRDDKIIMDYYNDGLSDQKIAEKFGMCRMGIYCWRKKNGLIANHSRNDGEKNLSSQQLKESFKRTTKKQIANQIKRQKENPNKFRQYQNKFNKIPRVREKNIIYFRKLNATPDRKKYKKDWDNKPENITKRPEQNKKWRIKHWKEYYQENKDRIKKDAKNRRLRNLENYRKTEREYARKRRSNTEIRKKYNQYQRDLRKKYKLNSEGKFFSSQP